MVKDPERGGKEAAKLWMDQERLREQETTSENDQVPLDCKASDTDSDNQKELNSPLCYSEAELGPAIDPLSCEKKALVEKRNLSQVETTLRFLLWMQAAK